eukprot:2901588-Prymnesium_polylepis.1
MGRCRSPLGALGVPRVLFQATVCVENLEHLEQRPHRGTEIVDGLLDQIVVAVFVETSEGRNDSVVL